MFAMELKVSSEVDVYLDSVDRIIIINLLHVGQVDRDISVVCVICS